MGADPREAIRDKAKALGFDAVGFAAPATGADAEARLARFLELGYHGDMGWLAANAARRARPTALWGAARSVVALGANYGPHEDPLRLLTLPERGSVSIYARGSDYHELIKKRLRALASWLAETQECEVKIFVDTAPVMEKPLAAQAGLGWQGKHTNLVSREFGSWLFLGEIYTDLELAPDAAETDHCGRCRACQDICPTAAFPEPYRLDARRCISYLTIEHKGHIAPEFRAAMGNRIYGCDDCLAVCPWNKFAARTREYAFQPRIELTAPRLADLVEMDDASFRSVFAGSPIKRIGRDRFVRNVLIAIGNSADPALAATAQRRLGDASTLVRAMAVWALSRLVPNADFATLKGRHLAAEPDREVRREWTASRPDPGRNSHGL